MTNKTEEQREYLGKYGGNLYGITDWDAPLAALIVGGLLIGVSLINNFVFDSRKPEITSAQKPKIEYRDVNQDNRQDIIMHLGGRDYVFLQDANRNYNLSNLERGVKE